jgi:isopenicillin-N epimerase
MTTYTPPAPLSTNLKTDWLLRPDITFLNHGSFGATPRAVFDEQNRWRQRLESEPVELLGRRCLELLHESKTAIGNFLNIPPHDFGLVTNATDGINAVLRSLSLNPGDEILTTNHVYNAVRQSMKYVARRAGATYREIPIPLPITSSQQITDEITAALRDNTRLLVLDHVTSPTALLLPVERIIEACTRRNIDLLIDGAHAPGMLPLDITKLNVPYYAGNLHKWCCAPKGSGFLYVRPDRQRDIHPNIISHHLGQGIDKEFGWQGTRDISPWLTIPAALDFMCNLGWDNVRRHNHALTRWAHQLLCDRWNFEPLTPLSGELLGSMATLSLPGKLQNLTEDQMTDLQQHLYTAHKIEVPLIRFDHHRLLRVCAAAYNTRADYERLAEVILRLS